MAPKKQNNKKDFRKKDSLKTVNPLNTTNDVLTAARKNKTTKTGSKIKKLKLAKQKNFVLKDVGVVVVVGDGVAKVIGLKGIKAGEFVFFKNNKSKKVIQGIALNLEKEYVSVAIFGNETLVDEGTQVRRGFRLVSVPTGKALLGRVIDPLGNVIDGQKILKLRAKNYFPIEAKAPGIITRQTVNEPVQTGITCYW